VKRTIFVTLAIALLAAVGGGAAYQAVAQRNYSALLTRGDTALRDDQTFNAIEAYSGAIALRPGSMLAYLRRGQTYQRRGDRGDLDAAARDFRTSARLDPTATRPLEALGDVLFQSQQYARASSAYERFVRLEPLRRVHEWRKKYKERKLLFRTLYYRLSEYQKQGFNVD
jgi:tetratricopeptide (TPR) repeat protein